ncbi:hypothetical protein [Polyangium sorediatum]|uniref:Lipoprotein n=1 Tax=Polyangium sorediatum TaxID=889274 RepID=A0ABT6NK09_9BACT|nr:hypothetical protein [Polyangium sorediatum]MDI1428641.1 hypothetical protein [Polyangium sorediatum]
MSDERHDLHGYLFRRQRTVFQIGYRLPVFLLAFTAPALCACTPTPPPEPKPSVGVSKPAVLEGAGDAAAKKTADEGGPDAEERGTRTQREHPNDIVIRLSYELTDHHIACDVAPSGPCTVQGDLDGDGHPDDVVFVRNRAGVVGIAVFLGTNPVELLGGGSLGKKYWTKTEVPDVGAAPDAPGPPEEIDADLGWIRRWELRPLKLRNGAPVFVGQIGKRTVESPAPDAVGDGLLLDSGDAAAILYRVPDGWRLMHLGF